MNQPKTVGTLGPLLIVVFAVTLFDSYVPHDMTLIRQVFAGIQLMLTLAIVAITLRSVLREF